MGKQTSTDVRELVLKLRNEGKTFREIGSIVNRSHNTVKKIVEKYKKFGKVENRPGAGRPKILNETEPRSIVRDVKKNPLISVVKISQEVSTASDTNVSASTIRRALHANGLHGRLPRKKPLISTVNQKKKDLIMQKNTKIGMFLSGIMSCLAMKVSSRYLGRKKMVKVWRTKNKEYADQNLITTVKHGGGLVMVWGFMVASGVSNLAFIESTMNKTDYLNILQNNLLTSVQKLDLQGSWIFQQDNDPKHTAKIVKEWLLYRTPKTLDHPPQSPDLNPIEHLWEHLDHQIRKRTITNMDMLKLAIKEEWDKISSDVTKKLVESMPRRLSSVIKAKGKSTKY